MSGGLSRPNSIGNHESSPAERMGCPKNVNVTCTSGLCPGSTSKAAAQPTVPLSQIMLLPATLRASTLWGGAEQTDSSGKVRE